MSDVRVYVVESMMLRHFLYVEDTFACTAHPFTFGSCELPAGTRIRSSRREEFTATMDCGETSFVLCEDAIECEYDLTILQHRGEYFKIRLPGKGGIFDGDRSLVVLYSDEAKELSGEFAQSLFAGAHGREIGDAALRETVTSAGAICPT
jgi:hypothetical protein